jgi:site-specific DNA-methyltransferase (adenine-specific)
MNIVHLIDCNDFMADKPDNYYPLAIVDPPYGIGQSKKKKYHAGAFTQYKPKKWDDIPPDGIYFDELFRVSADQIIWGANYFVQYLPPRKNWIVWDKMQPNGVSFSMHEIAYYSGDGQAKLFKHYNGANRCTNHFKAKKYIRIHPAQKPVALYKWLLQNYAKPGETIFDSHVGSGSIRIACHDLGFDFEGAEIDADYWQAQEDRYNNHIQQADLFEKDEIQDLIYNGRGNG